MDTVTRGCAQWQDLLTRVADGLARPMGFTLRRSKITGALFVQTVVFGWLASPSATLEELAQMAAVRGVQVSAQGLDQRFSEASATYLRAVLEAVVREGVVTPVEGVALPVLRRFTGVYVLDSTTLSLPTTLAHVWRAAAEDTRRGDTRWGTERRRSKCRCAWNCSMARWPVCCSRMGARRTARRRCNRRRCPRARCGWRTWAPSA